MPPTAPPTVAPVVVPLVCPLPEFDAAYRRAKRTAFGQAIARLHQGSSAAAATMLKIMVDPGVPPSTRLRAADCVFTHAKNAIEIEEIEARVAALEQAGELTKTGGKY